jgi:hypothetical protein
MKSKSFLCIDGVQALRSCAIEMAHFKQKLIALFDLLECIGYEWDSRRILPAIQQSVLIQGA